MDEETQAVKSNDVPSLPQKLTVFLPEEGSDSTWVFWIPSLFSDHFFSALFATSQHTGLKLADSLKCSRPQSTLLFQKAPLSSQAGSLSGNLQAHAACLTAVLTAKYIRTAKVWTSLPRTKWSSPRRSNVVKGLQMQDTQSCSNEKAAQCTTGTVRANCPHKPESPRQQSLHSHSQFDTGHRMFALVFAPKPGISSPLTAGITYSANRVYLERTCMQKPHQKQTIKTGITWILILMESISLP